MRVQRLRRDVSLFRPDDRASLGIGSKASGEVQIAERLKHSPVVQEVRQIDIGDQTILEPNVNQMALGCLRLDQKRGAAHGSMVDGLRQRLNGHQWSMFPSARPVVIQVTLPRRRPLEYEATRTRRQLT